MLFPEFQVEDEIWDESTEEFSDDSESSYCASELSEDDLTTDVGEDEECYNPEGIDSNDDDRKCCLWSKCADNQYQLTLSPHGSMENKTLLLTMILNLRILLRVAWMTNSG